MEFICDVCGHVSKSKKNLDIHVREIHDEAGEYPCDRCEYVAKNKKNIRSHMRTVHGPKNHRCDSCNYAATTARALKEHIARKHSNDRPIQCPDCNYTCKLPSDLKVTLTINIGKKSHIHVINATMFAKAVIR